MPQKRIDPFEPDDDLFEPDDDSLEVTVANPTLKPLPPTRTSAPDLARRPDANMFSVDPGFWEGLSQGISNRFGMSNLPERMRQPMAQITDALLVQMPRTVIEGLSAPESILAPGLIRGGARVPSPNPANMIDNGMELAPPVMAPKPKVRANPDGTFSDVNNKLVRYDKTGAVIPGPVEKLLEGVRTAKPLNPTQAQIYTAEKAGRIAKAEEITTPGLQGHYQRLGSLKGEHSKVSMEPVQLGPDDVDSLVNTINESRLPFYSRINATQGMLKILDGKVPQENELKLLERVFGPKTVGDLRASLPKIDSSRGLASDLVNLPRALQSSFDLSFGFRQGLGMIHTKSWWKNMWGNAAKSFKNENVYNGIMDEITSRPNYRRVTDSNGVMQPSFAEKAGLQITDLHDLGNREEAIMSTLAERVPGVRASNRSYNAAANTIRADNFDKLIEDAEAIYKAAKETGKARPGFLVRRYDPEQAELLNPRTNLELARKIADYVNTASGRGSLGRLERSASNLNAVLFSPRLMASRLKMMNPATYVKQDPFVRKEYLKSVLGLASAWGTFAGLGAMAGADVSTDPNSTDFGKIKIGNTRFDPAGGFQQYLVLANRLGSSYTSNTEGEETRLGEGFGTPTKGDIVIRFLKNKLAPVPGFAADFMFANENQPFDMSDRSVRMFTPIMLQDLSEIIQGDPEFAELLGIPLAAIGLGVQTYDERGDEPTSVIPGLSGPLIY